MRQKQNIVRTDSWKQEGLQQKLLGLKGTPQVSLSTSGPPQHLSTSPYPKSLQLKGWAFLPLPQLLIDPFITSATLGFVSWFSLSLSPLLAVLSLNPLAIFFLLTTTKLSPQPSRPHSSFFAARDIISKGEQATSICLKKLNNWLWNQRLGFERQLVGILYHGKDKALLLSESGGGLSLHREVEITHAKRATQKRAPHNRMGTIGNSLAEESDLSRWDPHVWKHWLVRVRAVSGWWSNVVVRTTENVLSKFYRTQAVG